MSKLYVSRSILLFNLDIRIYSLKYNRQNHEVLYKINIQL